MPDKPDEPENTPDWGAYLRKYREDGGLSRAEVATKLKVTESYIHLVESGKRRVLPDFPARYVDAVQSIVRERAEKIGFIVTRRRDQDA